MWFDLQALSPQALIAMDESNWYYIDRAESVGPVDEAALRQRIRNGLLERDDLVWQEGMPDWIKAGDVPGLLPPPIPTASIEASSPTPPSVTKSPGPSTGKDDRAVTPQLSPTEESLISAPAPPAETPPLAPSGEVIDLDRLSSASPMQPHADGVSLSFAGFWKRLAALVIDYIIIFAAMFALILALGLLVASVGAADTYSAEDWEAIANCSGVLAIWLYFAGMESSSHQGTLGKMALGIKVTDLSGRPIGFGRACGRHFSKIISGIILGIGYLFAAFTSKKQALHDIIAGCLVVNK